MSIKFPWIVQILYRNFSTWPIFLHKYNLWYLWQIWALLERVLNMITARSEHDMAWGSDDQGMARLRHEWYFANNIYSWTHGHYFICTKCWPICQSTGHLYFAFLVSIINSPFGILRRQSMKEIKWPAIDFVPSGGARWWASEIISAAATNFATLSLSRKSLNLQFAAKTDFQHSNSSLAFQLLN